MAGVLGQAYFLLAPYLRQDQTTTNVPSIKKAINETRFNVLIAFFLAAIYSMGGILIEYLDGRLQLDGSYLAGFALYFAGMLALLCTKEILPAINEKSMLVFNLLFVYLILAYWQPLFQLNTWLGALIAIPTLATIVNSLARIQIGNFWKVFFYGWYLVIALTFLLFQYLSADWVFLGFDDNWTPIQTGPATLAYTNCLNGIPGVPCGAISIWQVLVTGAALLYLLTHVMALFRMVPWPQKHTPYRRVIKEWKEYLQMIAGKFGDEQLHPMMAVIIIAGIAVVLLANASLHFAEDLTLINGLLLATQWLGQPSRPPALT